MRTDAVGVDVWYEKAAWLVWLVLPVAALLATCRKVWGRAEVTPAPVAAA